MQGFLETRETRANYEACREYTKEHAKTFYFASHVLPAEQRNAAYALYAICRYADNLIDAGPQGAEVTRTMKRLRGLADQIRYMYAFSPLMDSKLLALRETVMKFRIPAEYFLDLLRGVEMDLTRKRYETFEELLDYCYCVASVVGLMMAKVFGVTDEGALRAAADMGTAMQLTNILRDVREDHLMGRVYLPAEDLERFGVTESMLESGIVNDEFRALMRFEIARARGYFKRGEEGLPLIPESASRFCASLMGKTYERILGRIERQGYDIFSGRAYVPASEKLRVAARVAGASVAFRGVSRKSRPVSPSPFAIEPFPIMRTQ